MEIRIVPIREEHIAGYHACLDRVARERRYLAFIEAPPLEMTRNFVLGNIGNGNPHFVALDGSTVVGWCDIGRTPRPTMMHVGTLGMGLDEDFRGLGIGTALIRAALAASKELGLEKVELGVLESNARAQGLYRKLGFVEEGRLVRKFKVDGRYEDMLLMGVFLE